MADIRINALTSTAGTTASDDYFAVDGAANGTRKLSAYSPVLGGDLTVGGTVNVNGTATSTFKGTIVSDVNTNTTPSFRSKDTLNSGDSWRFGIGTTVDSQTFGFYDETTSTAVLSLGRTGNATLSGNLTVSGNGLNTFGGTGATNASILFGANNVANASAGYLSISQRLNYGFALFGYNMTGTSGSDAYTSPKNATGSAGVELIGGSLGITRFIYSTAATTAGNALTVTESARFSSGNLLIGTTTDSGNGKLQLATGAADKTSGIGFSSDTSLYRYQGGRIALDHLGGSLPVFSFLTNGTTRFSVYANGTTGTLETSNGSIQLATSGAIALTIDTSQNATFANGLVAGKTLSVNSITGGDAGAGTSIISFKDGLGATKVNITGDGKVVLSNTAASTSTSTGALVVSGGVGVAGAVNTGGDIKIQKADAQLEIRSASDAAGQFQYLTFGSPNYNRAQFRSNNQGVADGAISLYTFDAGIPVVAQYWTKSGNSLLGTTTDSGNGKLQLATHTTSAGGIGFGTDVSIWRNSANQLTTSCGTLIGNGGGIGYFSINTSGTAPLVLGTNGVEGFRLDGSNQNATFAGRSSATTAYGTAKSVTVDFATSTATNVTRTFTVTIPSPGLAGTFLLEVGIYGNSGTGLGSLLVKGYGYFGSASLYDATEISKVSTGNITVSSITKGNGSFTFTVLDTTASALVAVKYSQTSDAAITTLPTITSA